MVKFKTKQEALNMGYAFPKKGARDISDPSFFGYEFEEDGIKTVLVFFSEEKNRIRELGVFMPMFPPK